MIFNWDNFDYGEYENAMAEIYNGEHKEEYYLGNVYVENFLFNIYVYETYRGITEDIPVIVTNLFVNDSFVIKMLRDSILRNDWPNMNYEEFKNDVEESMEKVIKFYKNH